MRRIAILLLLSGSLTGAQGWSDFKSALSNVLDAHCPQLASEPRVQIHFDGWRT
jgi:hypothetical protein